MGVVVLPNELLQLALNAGVAGLLSIVVIYWYRSDSQERLKAEEKRTKEAEARAEKEARAAEARAEAERADKRMLLDVISANVTSQKEMADAVRDNAGATRELRQVINQMLMAQSRERGG